MTNNLPFVDVKEVTEEGSYDVSDSFFISDWWPAVKVYNRNGKLRMMHPENNVLEITLSGIKGWWFRKAYPYSTPFAKRAMTDAELLALTAIVNQETQVMGNANADRLRDNFALAYAGYGDYFLILERELKERGLIP